MEAAMLPCKLEYSDWHVHHCMWVETSSIRQRGRREIVSVRVRWRWDLICVCAFPLKIWKVTPRFYRSPSPKKWKTHDGILIKHHPLAPHLKPHLLNWTQRGLTHRNVHKRAYLFLILSQLGIVSRLDTRPSWADNEQAKQQKLVIS